jgi:ubiquinone biosynthesis protein
MRLSTIPQIHRHLKRWAEISIILSKYGLAGWISRLDINFGKNFLKDREGAALALYSRETRIRLAITELGPTFIKLGQILSTRPDLVGLPLAEELKHLQDEVPADPPEVVRRTIEDELGHPLEDLFAEFNLTPIASASIGQVHRARLRTGQQVVVKVQHSDIERKIRVDLDIMTGLAVYAERRPDLAAYRPKATVAEFQRTMRRELDFGREERNIQQFACFFAKDGSVRIPRTYPELTTVRVLTMELLEGVKLSERPVVLAGEFDLEEVARRGADLYLKMIFKHGFYHADPHPGNIMLLPGNVIGLLDFGMVGRIDEKLREQVEEMLLAIVNHDALQLANVITRIGSIPESFDYASLTSDVSDFVSNYAHQRIDQLDLSRALTEMIEMIRRYQILLPAQIALLLKVLVMLEGTARLACPTFSLMQVMKPYQQTMLWHRISPARRFKKLQRIYGEVEDLVEILPRRMREILRQVQSGKFDVHLDHRGLEPSVNRLVLGMLASALFLGSSLLLSMNVRPLVRDVSVVGATGCIVAVFLGLRLLRAINKSGHLDRRN